MTKKSFLILTLWAFSLVGIGGIIGLLGQSMSPKQNQKAWSERPTIDISQLAMGETLLVKYPIEACWWHHSGNRYCTYVFLYRVSKQEVRAWYVQATSEGIGMPDNYWWMKPFYLCKHFAPDPKRRSGKKERYFRCHDETMPEYWKDYWVWDLHGKSQSWMRDMDPVHNADVVGETFYYTH